MDSRIGGIILIIIGIITAIGAILFAMPALLLFGEGMSAVPVTGVSEVIGSFITYGWVWIIAVTLSGLASLILGIKYLLKK